MAKNHTRSRYFWGLVSEKIVYFFLCSHSKISPSLCSSSKVLWLYINRRGCLF